MQVRALFLTAVLLGNAGLLYADDEKVFSGPQKGEKLAGFKVLGVHDDIAGKEVDFVAKADGKPLLLLFVHEATRPSMAVTRALTGYADSRKKDDVHTYVVWLTADRTKAEEYLKKAKDSIGVKVPIGISPDGIEGPGAYGLNRKVTLTILIAKDNKVSANFALIQPSLTDTPKIAEELVKVAGGKAPTQKELEAFANPARPKDKDKPDPDRPGKRPEDPKLIELLRAVIRSETKEEDVKKAAEEVEKYVGEDKAKRTELGEAAKFIQSLGYGTDAAKKQLAVWAEKYGLPEKKK